MSIFFFTVAAGAADLEEQTRQIAAELRCPVCQNLSVADSPSELAQQMRAVIAEQLKEGKTPEQVKAFFVSKYGEWVLLAPSPKGFSLLLWIFPYAAALTGVVVVLWIARRWVGRAKKRPAAAFDPELVSRMRREAEASVSEAAPREADTPQEMLQQERRRVYSYLRDLEFDYEAGKISAADYQDLRRGYETQAVAILQESEALPRPKAPAPAERSRAPAAPALSRARFPGFWRQGWVLALGGSFILVFGVSLGVLLSASLRPRESERDSITGDFLTGTGPGGISPGATGTGGPDGEFFALVSQGRAAFERRDLPAAIDAFKRAAELRPEQPEPHAYMGLILAQAGHYDGALMAFDRALAGAPNFALALWGKGMLLYHVKKEPAAAREYLEKVLRLMPAGPEREEVQKVLVEINLGSGAAMPTQSKTAAAPTISGTVSVADSVQSAADTKSVLFIIARTAQGGGGPPLAVKKVERPRFPVSFTLSQENVMMPGVPFSGKVVISARLDKDGNPATREAGDLTGEYKNNPVEVGAQKVEIVIDKAM